MADRGCGTAPICGQEWLEEHKKRFPNGLPEQGMELYIDGKRIASVNPLTKSRFIKDLMKAMK